MSVRVSFADVANALAHFAPLALQESYDNSGLLVGEATTEVSSILVCLDVSEAVVAEALHLGCNLIVSHHPPIFHALKNLRGDNPTTRVVIAALRAHIGLIAAHTNLDAAAGGVSSALATKLGLTVERVLHPIAASDNNLNPNTGFGVIGSLTTPLTEAAFLELVSQRLAQPFLRHSALCGRPVQRIAVCGGSGFSFYPDASALNADAYLTADLKYHDFQIPDKQLLLVDAGHYETERCAVDLLYQIVSERFPTFACTESTADSCPVCYFTR